MTLAHWLNALPLRRASAGGFSLAVGVRARPGQAPAAVGLAWDERAPVWTARDGRIAAALGLALFCTYLLTFAGVFRSIDELALFGMTENLVQAGTPEAVLVDFARFHNPVGLLEAGYPLLATPLYALAGIWRQVSNMHAVMLLNPLLTAANASLVYLFGRRLGYAARASLAVSLAFGLATMAWPYTKTFLREPAVALLWTVAFMGAALFLEAPRWRPALVMAAAAGLAAAVKAASVVAWPVLLGVLLWALYRSRRLSRAWLVTLVLGCVGVAVLMGLLLLTLRGLSAASMLSGLLRSPLDRESLVAWYGLLLSPGKSVFVYSPVLLVAVVSFPGFYRRHPALAVALAGLWLVLLFSLRISVWTGGLTWGPRFLLPLLPLSVLPALERLTRWGWAAALAVGSAAFQAAVSMVDWSKTYQYLNGRYPGVNPDLTVGLDWLRAAESPAGLALRLWGRSTLDLVWLHGGLAGELKLNAGLGLALAAVVVVAGGGLWAAWQARGGGKPLLAGLLLCGLATAGLLWRGAVDLPDQPGLEAGTARQLARQVSASASFTPTLLVNVSPDFGTHYWLGLVKGPMRRRWVSPAQADGFAPWLLAQPEARVSVVVDRPHIASHYPGDQLISWLDQNAYRLGSEWLAGYELFRYAAVSNTSQRAPTQAAWPTGAALTAYQVPGTAQPGTALPIDLTFERLPGDWSASDRLFTNLVNAEGQVIAGQESVLQYGHLAATGWPAGQAAHERRGLWLPAQTAPGAYLLVVGFSNDQGYVPTRLPDGQTLDYLELVVVVVSP